LASIHFSSRAAVKISRVGVEFMSVILTYSFPNERKLQDVIKKKIKIANENAVRADG
jgi:hypothetical protein